MAPEPGEGTGPAPEAMDLGQDLKAGPEDPGPSLPDRTPTRALGLFQFTMDGRAAPGLFVTGWIAVLVGGSAAFVGLLAGRTLPGVILFVVGLVVVLVALVLLGGSQAIERRRAGLAYAGPSPLLGIATVIVGWYVAAVVVVTPLSLLGVQLGGPALSLLGIVIQAIVVVAVLRLTVVGTEALTWREMGWSVPDRAALREFAVGALYVAPAILVTSLLVMVLVALAGQQPTSPLPATGSLSGLFVNLLAGAVITPVYEELFFRGFALTAWRRMGGARQAIVRSALLFASIHVIDQTGPTFAQALGVAAVAAGARLPVALALGYVFERRRSLWASIGLHATFNAVLLILAERALTG